MAYNIMLQEQTINRFEIHPRQLWQGCANLELTS